jgi:GT2 family glycosyltransferase
VSAPIGLVVIGRNEGERLRRCLEDLRLRGLPLVYVDSGSTDGSAALARGLGCEVLEVSPERPFSAARARNEGLEFLVARHPGLACVQFVDGDAVLVDGWLERAGRTMEERPDACAVLGRLRERSPEASVYNRICGLEWNLPVGEVHTFGGLCLVRVESFRRAGGFDLSLPAGEEPELSQRMRRAGGRILSIDAEMAVHDAALTRFSQWWKRAVRSGHAYAQVCAKGSGLRGRFGLRQCLRIWVWAAGVPALSALSFFLHPAAPAGGLVLWLLQMLRVAASMRRRGAGAGAAAAYGVLWLPAQFAQWIGHGKFLLSALRRRPPQLMEYKAPPPAGGSPS